MSIESWIGLEGRVMGTTVDCFVAVDLDKVNLCTVCNGAADRGLGRQGFMGEGDYANV